MKKYLLLCLVALMPWAHEALAAGETVNLTTGGQLEIFKAYDNKVNGMAVILCPGGGYAYRADANEGTDWADFFNSRGFTIAVLKYRLPKGNPEIPISDAKAALAYFRDNAEALNISPDSVGIMGCSAGGHLASTIATHTEGSERPAFQILFYPVITMETGKTHQGSIDELLGTNPSKELVELYSNQKHVTEETPVAYVTYSTNDGTVAPATNGKVYYDALVEAGVKASLKTYPVGGHGWAKLVGQKLGATYQAEMQNHLTEWLSQLPELIKPVQKFPEVTTYTVDADVETVEGFNYRLYPNLQTIVLNSPTVAEKNYSAKSNLLSIFGTLPSTYIFGEGVTSIGKYALVGAENLVSVQFPSTLKVINAQCFSKCTSLSDVAFTGNVEDIGIGAFSYTKIANLNLDGVKTIRSMAFMGCEELQTIEISEAIDSIYASTFKKCTSLVSIKCHSIQPPRVATTFIEDEQKAKTTLYVPIGSKAAYEASAAWSGFAAIEEFAASSVESLPAGNTKSQKGAYLLDGRPAAEGRHGIVIVDGKKLVR